MKLLDTTRFVAPALALAASLFCPIAHSQAPPKKPFEFTKVDLKLLEECDALDRQLQSHALVYNDPALEKHLAEIAAPLIPKEPLEHVEWRFHILRDPLVNAFALPNGSIYVNSGLIALAENDDQVAGVLAHEAIHVTHRHSYLFNRSLRKKNVWMGVIAATTGWFPVGGIWGSSVWAVANGSQVALIFSVYGYSQTEERDADLSGIDNIKASGRDPAQTVRMFELFDQRLEPSPVPLILFDHPRTLQRIQYLKEALGLKADVPPANDPAYVRRMRAIFRQNIQMDFDSRHFRSAIAASNRLVEAQPSDAEALYCLAESYRALGPRSPEPDQAERTDAGQRKAYRKVVRQTEQEETARLMQTPEGRTRLEANQRKAEELFRKALALDPHFAQPDFALGMLYEQQDKPQLAVAAYRQYLDLAPQGADRERAENRIAELTSKGRTQ